MKLVINEWKKSDFLELRKLLKSLATINPVWQQKIVGTKLDVIGVRSSKLDEICKDVLKGNYKSFLDNIKPKFYEESLLQAKIISKISDLKEQKDYLLKYLEGVDNWACVDSLNFKIKSKNSDEYFLLAKSLLKLDKVFFKRCGLVILLKLTDDRYIVDIFSILDSLKNEKEYYVNMAAAWLLCTMFIKNRELTIEYFRSAKTNSFIINKAISKCRDSFRVSSVDKEYLLNFKRKEDFLKTPLVAKKPPNSSSSTKNFKQKYFEKYDDIKSHTHRVYDW